MSKLACNIAMYHPDLRVLSARYRFWHVKALLDEGSALIDRCLQEFKDYSALDYAWNQFHLGLKTQERQIYLDRKNHPEEPSEPEAPPPAEEAEAPTEEAEEEEPAAEEEAAAEGEGAPEEAQPEEEPALTPPPAPQTTLELRAEAVRRKKELSAPGQPFALNDQRDLTLKRLCRDFEEAVNRAWVAEQGLRKIYDHAELASPLPTEAESLSESITNLALWLRDAREWLRRYEQHEQCYTRVVSVRSLVGRTQWAVLKQSSRDTYSAKLRVPPELFRSHDNTLLRGVGAWLIGEVGAVPWSIIVRVPDDGIYERWGQSVEVDQSGRPACLMGRVENRRSIHPVEISGTNSLMNASPIGKPTQDGMWSIEIYKPPGATSESFSHLEDVVLEFSVAGIPQRNMS